MNIYIYIYYYLFFFGGGGERGWGGGEGKRAGGGVGEGRMLGGGIYAYFKYVLFLLTNGFETLHMSFACSETVCFFPMLSDYISYFFSFVNLVSFFFLLTRYYIVNTSYSLSLIVLKLCRCFLYGMKMNRFFFFFFFFL